MNLEYGNTTNNDGLNEFWKTETVEIVEYKFIIFQHKEYHILKNNVKEQFVHFFLSFEFLKYEKASFEMSFVSLTSYIRSWKTKWDKVDMPQYFSLILVHHSR